MLHHYPYAHGKPTWDENLVWAPLERLIKTQQWREKRSFDFGWGNGSICGKLVGLGFEVSGIDPSSSGIEFAKKTLPIGRFEVASSYDDLAAKFGTFPLVVSIEVVEHCMEPRLFARRFLDLIEPSGIGFLTTPYHGYLKNLAIAVSGKMDNHFTALWDGGHVKFFSIKTLSELLREAGAKDITFLRLGRIPPLAKSMAAIVRK